MSRIVYVNGDYLPEDEAKISIFDRGFLMADGVYEVTSVLDGKLIDFTGHAARLERSLSELDMRSPVTNEELLEIHRTLVARNGIDEGLVYLQITRGAPGDRDFVFPDPDEVPSSLARMETFTPQALRTVNSSSVACFSLTERLWSRPKVSLPSIRCSVSLVPVA